MTVEDIQVGECNRPFDLEIMVRQDEDGQTLFSNFDGAILRNIKIERNRNEGNFWQCHIRGYDEAHQIRNVRLENLPFADKTLESLDDEDTATNDFIDNVQVFK